MANDDREMSDKEKVKQGVARRGEERANGPRGSTRATPETEREARKPEGDEKPRTKDDPGRGAGLQTWDSGGGDIARGG
jgi:hypothetical protein